MQILELILYGLQGQKRVLSFRLGRTNIITGKSRTGKSAVGDIIEYCLGGKDCNIADGVVRDNVSWYGLLLQFDKETVFIARKNPEQGQLSTSTCYYEIGDNIGSPETCDFEPNTNTEGIEKILTQKLGISENIHNPEFDESRLPLEANIRHSLYYCFQRQDEVAARAFLFHRQNEPFMATSIRDTLPYFLGAVDEDAISLSTERREKDRECRILKRQLAELNALSKDGTEKAINLLGEAASVGLIENIQEIDTTDFNGLWTTLQKIDSVQVEPFEGSIDLLSELQHKLSEKEEELRTLQNTIYETEGYLIDASGYNTEIGHQKQRLESIGLFEQLTFDTGKCPLCGGVLDQELPSIEMMKSSIRVLDQAIRNVSKDSPRLRRVIDKYKNQESVLKREISTIKATIEGVYAQIDDDNSIRDINTRRAKVIGRISYWLDNMQQIDNSHSLEKQITDLERRINEIDLILSNASISDRVQSALSVIQTDMTEWAKRLELEYAGSPYRLDLVKVTAVVDKGRPIPLSQMGSGSNWLGTHLITLFSLHKFFIENDRPVPRFLFLDQPSQVYFPEGIIDEDDQDIIEVRKIYSFIHQLIDQQCGKMQVIIVDHAKLNTDEFKKDTREEWRDGRHYLVPTDWYVSNKLAPIE